MTRFLVQLRDDQLRSLRRVSAATGKPVAGLIREAVNIYLNLEQARRRALQVAGKFASGTRDVSAHHDRYLSEAFRK